MSGISDAPSAPREHPGRTDDGWRRLDPRAPLVAGAVMASVAIGACPPVGLILSGASWAGGGPWPGTATLLLILGAVLLIAGGAGTEHLRLRRTRYRIGADTVELHSGILLLSRRSLARERIRSVDLTAHPLLRVLGLVKVKIATGEQAGSGTPTLELSPVSRAEGERLRRELLDRARTAEDGTRHEGRLVRLDPSWIRYAPLSFVAPALGGAAVGAVLQLSDWFGVQEEVIGGVGDVFRGTSIPVMIVGLVLAALLAGVVGSLGLWTEMWWNHRLEREPGGTLGVRRGLFTTRSITLEERRLRGVELVEPLGVRLVGAARVDAVAVGVGQSSEDEHADLQVLLPAAPRAVADAVVARVLREPVAPTGTPLVPHPRAARGRRIRWALLAVAGPSALLAGLGVWLTPVLLWIAAGVALVGLPAALLWARDAHRSLGHALSGDFVVVRAGVFRRSTVALRRAGVTGWVVRQSVFQRRVGLVSLTATTAAGAGGYVVRDAAASDALRLAASAVPGLLDPFLEPAPSASE
ncbi:PH domain-containing protein [Streptomyces sp. NPDC000594]|uniref:PH domain-containing protein n=1 Tax=Streptomyces sp. NPDC000594 TaxID=3154261 RepID=UPI0033328661